MNFMLDAGLMGRARDIYWFDDFQELKDTVQICFQFCPRYPSLSQEGARLVAVNALQQFDSLLSIADRA